MLTRRRLLACAAALPLSALPFSARAAGAAVLRLRVLRYQTVLVEIDGRRVLFDPAFARGLGVGPLVDAPAPALRPEDVGALDLLCATAHAPGAFDARSTRLLRDRATPCLVADERSARALRGQGFARVAVVRAGDDHVVHGMRIRVGPSRSALGGDAVAFHLEAGGRSVLHVGAARPLEDPRALLDFARAHPAEVVSSCAQGLIVAGVPITFDDDEADLLAAAADARVVVRLGHDVQLSALGAVLAEQAVRPRARAQRASTARIVVPLSDTWYRVAPG